MTEKHYRTNIDWIPMHYNPRTLRKVIPMNPSNSQTLFITTIVYFSKSGLLFPFPKSNQKLSTEKC